MEFNESTQKRILNNAIGKLSLDSKAITSAVISAVNIDLPFPKKKLFSVLNCGITNPAPACSFVNTEPSV